MTVFFNSSRHDGLADWPQRDAGELEMRPRKRNADDRNGQHDRGDDMPMMVIAMMIAASTQPAAIHSPPKRIQSRFIKKENGDIISRFRPERRMTSC